MNSQIMKSNYIMHMSRWLYKYMTEHHQVEDLATTKLNCWI